MKKNYFEGLAAKGDYTNQDLDTIIDLITEAKEIGDDSELMKLVRARAGKRADSIRSIQDIRDASNNMADDVNEEDSGPVDTKPKKKKKSVSK